LQQFAVYDEVYPPLQEVILEVREKVQEMSDDDVTVTKSELKRWRNELIKIDKIHRERILTLTVAAECGWKVAGDMAFIKKGTNPLQDRGKKSFPRKLITVLIIGDLTDKALAKALKLDRKRKEEAPTSSKAKKKKGGSHSYGGNSHYGKSFSQPVAQFSPHVPPPPIGRQETRTCLGCRQVGHLMKNCPRINSGIPAALGAAPKYESK